LGVKRLNLGPLAACARSKRRQGKGHESENRGEFHLELGFEGVWVRNERFENGTENEGDFVHHLFVGGLYIIVQWWSRPGTGNTIATTDVFLK
jgi:hypothetical protein